MDAPRVRLGELLVRAGLISAEDLDEALAEQQRVGKRLGTVLVQSGLVSETQVTQVLSQQLSVPWVSLHHIDFSRELLNLVPLDLVEKYCLIPIYVRRVRGLGDALYIAMDDPTNSQALTDVAERSRLHVRAMIAPPSDIRAALRAYYGVGDEPAPARDAGPVAVRPAESPVAPTRPAMAANAPPKRPPTQASVGPSPAAPVAPATSGSVAALGPPLTAADVGERPAPAAPRTGSTGPRPPAGGGAAAKSAASRAPAKPGRGGPRMIALTLLDGTTIRLPAKTQPAEADAADQAPHSGQLTARDLITALRAASRGADASEVLGEDARWESMFAALLSLLLKKHLVADWEFVEELKKG